MGHGETPETSSPKGWLFLPRAPAGWEGQKLSALEVRGAGEPKPCWHVCCESGSQASPRDGGSAGKPPIRAPPQWGFPSAFEKIENRLLLPSP